MKLRSNQFLLAAALLVTGMSANATGFRAETLDFPGTQDLNVGIWYPSDQAPPAEPNTPFGLPMAIDAPISSPNGGLVLISHGFSGWYAGHARLAAALADAGFIVAAPSHSGNTWSDMSSTVDKWFLDRPGQISRVIDHMLNDDELRAHIDPAHIGVYGFSAGGFTVLNLIGGTPDFERAEAECNSDRAEFVCDQGWVDEMLAAGLGELPAESSGWDKRISAASIAAPGFGFAYNAESLKRISVPVQLWAAEFDHSVPAKSNSEWLESQLPTRPDYRLVENANHFAFLIMPCREAFKQEDPEEYEMVCGDAEGFDRQAFHEAQRAELIAFFEGQFSLK